MTAAMRFPLDWLDPHAGDTATDLDLAVLLVNSFDALDEPPDRLRDLRWLTAVLHQVGHGHLADELGDEDLGALHELRAGLRTAFESTDVTAAAAALNPMLAEPGAISLLVSDLSAPSQARMAAGVGAQGLEALQIRLPVAVAHRIATQGVASLGACHADPCHCVFVDRTRAKIRRFCCGWCNDRAAARAYRRRQGR